MNDVKVFYNRVLLLWKSKKGAKNHKLDLKHIQAQLNFFASCSETTDKFEEMAKREIPNNASFFTTFKSREPKLFEGNVRIMQVFKSDIVIPFTHVQIVTPAKYHKE